MSDEIDELPADLRALLEAERDRSGPSPADRDALRAGLGSLLDGGPSGGSGSGTPTGGAGGAAGGAAAGGSALGKLAAVFLAGSIAGGTIVYAVGPRTAAPDVAASAPTAATASPAVTTATTPSDDAPPAFSAATGSTAKVAPSASPPPKSAAAGSAARGDEELASERALLERARVALGRGDSTEALTALERHATRHPSGRLAEEREVLAVQALVRAGRQDEARARAARFHREHPSSAFGSAIDALVR